MPLVRLLVVSIHFRLHLLLSTTWPALIVFGELRRESRPKARLSLARRGRPFVLLRPSNETHHQKAPPEAKESWLPKNATKLPADDHEKDNAKSAQYPVFVQDGQRSSAWLLKQLHKTASDGSVSSFLGRSEPRIVLALGRGRGRSRGLGWAGMVWAA